jgi:hypothetical protein
MSEYRKDYKELERESYWTFPRILLFGFVAVSALSVIGVVSTIISAPGRVITKTLNTDNIIQKYEWFYDAAGNFKARTNQVKQYKELWAGEKDEVEKRRLRIDMAAIQQSCRDLGQRYNANALKANQSIFMGRDAPSQVPVGDCE